MLLAEFPESFELDEVAHGASPRFFPNSLEEAHLDPSGRLIVLDPQMGANLAQAHRVRAETSMFLAVEEVVKALRVIAESERRIMNSMLGDVLDQLIRLPAVEFVSRTGSGPLDAVLVQEPPARTLVIAGDRRKFFA